MTLIILYLGLVSAIPFEAYALPSALFLLGSPTLQARDNGNGTGQNDPSTYTNLTARTFTCGGSPSYPGYRTVFEHVGYDSPISNFYTATFASLVLAQIEAHIPNPAKKDVVVADGIFEEQSTSLNLAFHISAMSRQTFTWGVALSTVECFQAYTQSLRIGLTDTSLQIRVYTADNVQVVGGTYGLQIPVDGTKDQLY